MEQYLVADGLEIGDGWEYWDVGCLVVVGVVDG